MTDRENTFRRSIDAITIRNLLSFGPDGCRFDFHDFNLLIGPNGSGKSNLFDLLSLVRDLGTDLPASVRRLGGASELFWKGAGGGDCPGRIEVEFHLESKQQPLRYVLDVVPDSVGRVVVTDERIEYSQPADGNETPYFFYSYQSGHPAGQLIDFNDDGTILHVGTRRVDPASISPRKSVLSQLRGDEYPVVTSTADLFASIAIYQTWTFGRSGAIRPPQEVDQPSDALLPDARNLAVMVSELTHAEATRRSLVDGLRQLYEGIVDIRVKPEGGRLGVYVYESHLDTPIALSRLSDGTYRWLTLLVAMLGASGSSLICIDEPELGLHPDALQSLARTLLDTSNRIPVVATTHDEAMLDSMDHASDVVVVERSDAGTTARRLDAAALSPWLAEYSLSHVWMSGEIGGTRW